MVFKTNETQTNRNMRQTLYDIKYKNSKVKVNSKLGFLCIFDEDGTNRIIPIDDFFRKQKRIDKILRVYKKQENE